MQYDPPTLDDFREIRRALPVLAAALLLAAPLLPMWEIWVYAVQYPDEVLHLQLYAYPRITGDYVEMYRLNKYIGFYYPDPVLWRPNFTVHPNAIEVPEWSLGPLAFVAVAGAGLFVAVAPTVEKLRRGLRWQFAGSIAVLTVVMADIQYRLYQAGHTLDPGAPVLGVDGFTPPLWGKYEVANITSYSRFGAGAYLTGVAVLLLAVAYYYRRSDATVGELPGRLRRAARGSGDRPTAAPDETDGRDGSVPADGAVPPVDAGVLCGEVAAGIATDAPPGEPAMAQWW